MSTLSTHVLDAVRGVPAAGIAVTLFGPDPDAPPGDATTGQPAGLPGGATVGLPGDVTTVSAGDVPAVSAEDVTTALAGGATAGLPGNPAAPGDPAVVPSGIVMLASAVTDADGRIPSLGDDLVPGVHRLRFETGAYFAAQGVSAFYPEITVAFTITGERHLHIPLLLSPFAYSTYRGS